MSGFERLLKEARTRAGLSQPELAEKVGVDKSYISKLERGVESPPSRKVTVKLAEALGIFDKIKRVLFFLAAYVAGEEDMQGLALVRVVDDEAAEEKGQAISSLSPSDQLAATGTFGSPGSLVGNQTQQLPTFEEEVRQILTSAHLPYAKRMIAQQMSLEAIRIICWGLKEAE